MKQICVGSKNPVKIKAVKRAAKSYWEKIQVIGVDVENGISKMPLSKQETRRGAKNRAINSLKKLVHG